MNFITVLIFFYILFTLIFIKITFLNKKKNNIKGKSSNILSFIFLLIISHLIVNNILHNPHTKVNFPILITILTIIAIIGFLYFPGQMQKKGITLNRPLTFIFKNRLFEYYIKYIVLYFFAYLLGINESILVNIVILIIIIITTNK